MFKCECCGNCCKNIAKSELYSDLDRGDGVCKYLIGNICSIYNERPLFCRIDECFELFFKEHMSIEEYYKLNYKECKKLKELGE